MRSHRLFAKPNAAAEKKRTDKARDTGVDVNDRAAGEVKRPKLEAITGLCESCFIRRC